MTDLTEAEIHNVFHSLPKIRYQGDVYEFARAIIKAQREKDADKLGKQEPVGQIAPKELGEDRFFVNWLKPVQRGDFVYAAPVVQQQQQQEPTATEEEWCRAMDIVTSVAKEVAERRAVMQQALEALRKSRHHRDCATNNYRITCECDCGRDAAITALEQSLKETK